MIEKDGKDVKNAKSIEKKDNPKDLKDNKNKLEKSTFDFNFLLEENSTRYERDKLIILNGLYYIKYDDTSTFFILKY